MKPVENTDMKTIEELQQRIAELEEALSLIHGRVVGMMERFIDDPCEINDDETIIAVRKALRLTPKEKTQ